MYTEKQIRKVIREELKSALVKYDKKRLVEQPTDATSAASEDGGASVALIKKGLVIAFPDWASQIEQVDLKSSFVDEFASLIKNALEATESGDLAKAEKSSDRMTAAL